MERASTVLRFAITTEGPDARRTPSPRRAQAPDDTGINAGHFSQAAEVDGTISIGGTLAIDQRAQRVVDDTPADAVRQAFANLKAI